VAVPDGAFLLTPVLLPGMGLSMIRMPWTNETAPNVMIEVVDCCNVKCRVCYHKLSNKVRSLEQIAEDLDDACRLRGLHTVTLTGGEPTLHPELPAIIRSVKQRGLHCFLLTNGLLIDPPMLANLKAAGLDSILFHVDTGQRRRDLPEHPDFGAVSQRLDELIRLAASMDLDVSLSTILYKPGDEDPIATYFLNHPDVTFLFLSKAVDAPSFFGVAGTPIPSAETPDGVRRISDYFRSRHGLEPFSSIPATNGHAPVWISWFVPILFPKNGSGPQTRLRYRSTWMDVALMKLARRISGTYIHKTTQNPTVTRLRIALNALSSPRILQSLYFLAHSFLPGRELRHKMIVYDDGPFHHPETGLQHCVYCPTAIVRDGKLRPCCTADYGPEAASA
jgi:hypothetical protein